MRDLSKIQDKIEKLINLCKVNKNIIALFIFGSFGTEFETLQSDIDLAILYEKTPEFEEELSIESEIVKILEREDVDIINLNKTNVIMQMNIISEGELLYCKDEIKLADFKEKVFDFYADYEPVMRKFYEDFIEGIKNERS